MPRTKGKAVARVNVRLPKPIVDEVDGIVRDSRLYVSRQQFIEATVREEVTDERLDRLTAEALEYHKELLRELKFLGSSR